jgi:hypothetical protein
LALWWVTESVVFTVVDAARWTENRDDRKKKVAQSYFFFFAFLDKNPHQIIDF